MQREGTGREGRAAFRDSQCTAKLCVYADGCMCDEMECTRVTHFGMSSLTSLLFFSVLPPDHSTMVLNNEGSVCSHLRKKIT